MGTIKYRLILHRPFYWKEGNVLFNDALITFYLRLNGVRHMVKDHSDSEKGNPLPPHGLLFPISSKGSFVNWARHVVSTCVHVNAAFNIYIYTAA